jgi:hypothetical protein
MGPGGHEGVPAAEGTGGGARRRGDVATPRGASADGRPPALSRDARHAARVDETAGGLLLAVGLVGSRWGHVAGLTAGLTGQLRSRWVCP